MSYRDKLNKIGPRKLLACDGGGIRGIISIEVLARIESELRKSSGNPKLVLADYFDYVAGTSTGAIIATLIALPSIHAEDLSGLGESRSSSFGLPGTGAEDNVLLNQP